MKLQNQKARFTVSMLIFLLNNKGLLIFTANHLTMKKSWRNSFWLELNHKLSTHQISLHFNQPIVVAIPPKQLWSKLLMTYSVPSIKDPLLSWLGSTYLLPLILSATPNCVPYLVTILVLVALLYI